MMINYQNNLNIFEKLYKKFLTILYKNKNIYVYEKDFRNLSLPSSVGYEAINICNARCSFCGYGKVGADPRKKIKPNLEVLHHTLSVYNESGGGSFTLSPILGEITAIPNLIEILEDIRSKYKNIKGLSFYTNAILLDRFDLQKLINSGVSDIDLSTCLSGKEDYKRVYGVDKFDQVKNNILNLLEVNKKNNNKVRIKILLRQDKPFDNFLKGDLYNKIVSYIPKSDVEFLDNQWDDFKGIIKKEDLPKNQQFKKQMDKTKPCYALFRKLEILVDGTIQGCACRVEPDLWTENIKSFSNLRDAWNNKTYNKIRNEWFEGKIPNSCNTCSHYIPYTNLKKGNPKKVSKLIYKKVKNKLLSYIK